MSLSLISRPSAKERADFEAGNGRYGGSDGLGHHMAKRSQTHSRQTKLNWNGYQHSKQAQFFPRHLIGPPKFDGRYNIAVHGRALQSR